ncbi:hypothetical protein CR513_33642, partial [Mucuna pruriens]
MKPEVALKIKVEVEKLWNISFLVISGIFTVSTDSPRHWPSRSRQRLSRDDLSRDNPARSRLKADRRYRDGLSLSQT